MTDAIHATSVAALADEPLDWRYKGLPASWWGSTPAQICDAAVNFPDEGVLGPVCVLRDEALSHNLATMADWCDERGVELAPHGKTHMAPQLLARQLASGATAVTVATVSQARAYRAFGVRDFILANELVDAAALRWVGAELSADAEFHFVCWVDSVAGVEQMAAHLDGSSRPVEAGAAPSRARQRRPRPDAPVCARCIRVAPVSGADRRRLTDRYIGGHGRC
jgi:D-serine deaminase-like pyridoxal phosphate-dependent protein